jgi:uncharacterized protein YegP (UPF0339 family)
MATATKQARTGRQGGHTEVDKAPSEFVVFQSNSGDYRWEVVAEGGATLAQSASFASFDDAEHAATQMREGAASARFETSASAGRRTAVARATKKR